MMKYLRWRSVVLGAAAFLAAHAVLVAKWAAWFGGQWEPWFLNDSGPAVVLTAAILFVAALAASLLWARDRGDAIVQGVNVAAGSAAAMMGVLAAIGPGTIFPIAIVVGIVIALASTFAASVLAAAFKPRSTRSV
jgi:hypothetical protein